MGFFNSEQYKVNFGVTTTFISLIKIKVFTILCNMLLIVLQTIKNFNQIDMLFIISNNRRIIVVWTKNRYKIHIYSSLNEELIIFSILIENRSQARFVFNLT